MSHQAEISRPNPTAFLFLIDQSGSMSDPWGADSSKSKAQGLADAINKLLQTLVIRCAKADGIRDYFHVGVIGYGERVGSVLAAAGGGCLTPLSVVADHPVRIEVREKREDDGTGGILVKKVKFAVWFDAVSRGGTPMCEALTEAWHVLNDFMARFPRCYPPLVINITDGDATDGDPESASACLRDLASTDGNVVLFNLHVSEHNAHPVLFPDSESGLPDEYALGLFQMSSVLPPPVVKAAQAEGIRVSAASRGFGFNTDLVSVVRFLDIGTRVDPRNLR